MFVSKFYMPLNVCYCDELLKKDFTIFIASNLAKKSNRKIRIFNQRAKSIENNFGEKV